MPADNNSSELEDRVYTHSSKELSVIRWSLLFSIWIWLLVSSRTFESKLPLKYLPSNLGVYGDNTTDLISMIDGISENETSTKIIEPSVPITNADLLISFTLYEYDNELENTDFDVVGKTLTLSFELEKPGANYYGLNADFRYDLQSVFDNTIYDLYFDEFATDFQNSMDLDKLSKWLQALGVLRLVLSIFLIVLLASILLSFRPKANRIYFKRTNQLVLGPCLILTHIGFLVCMSLIIDTFPSGYNILNMLIMILGSILATVVEFQGLL